MSTMMFKYRRPIMILLVLFAGGPLIFFGVGGFGSGGGNQFGQNNMPQAVGQVGEIPLATSDFLSRYNSVYQRRATDTTEPTAMELVADGTVEQILDMMVNDALIRLEAQRRGLEFDQEYLVEALKKYPDFQNEAGEFDPALWNQFVEMGRDQVNWNNLYTMVAEQLNRQLYGELLVASARVLEPELRKEYEKANTTIKVRSAAIEPKVELSEEELKTYFDENQDRFKKPEQRTATVVSFSLVPDADAAAAEVLTKARAGEDFGELAKQYSTGSEKDLGGDLGWVIETTNTPPHRMPLFSMQVDEISDPIQGPNGVYIYKVTAERSSDVAGKRDVLAKQILLQPSLTEEEKNAKRDLAQGLVAVAKDSADLAATATTEGFEAVTTAPFSQQSAEIDGVVSEDTLAYRREALKLEEGAISEVIEGANHLYVTQITEVIEPAPKTFEEAREEVESAAINAHKQKPEYRDRVDELIAEIENNFSSIDAIIEAHPELEIEVVETKAFKQDDVLFSDGVFWTPRDVFTLLRDKEVGAMVGPVIDFRQVPYFIELVERNAPDEATLSETWEEERDRLASNKLMTSQFERQQDYLQYLREQADQQYLIRPDMNAVAQVIGLDEEEAEEAAVDAAEGGGESPPLIVEGAPDEGGADEDASEDDLDIPTLEVDGEEAPADDAAEETSPAAETEEAPAEEETPDTP